MKLYITIFLFLFVGIDVYSQSQMPNVFLNKTMLGNKSGIKFNHSICYTKDGFLLLSSSNQFYLLGAGGIVPVYEKTNYKIDAFTMVSDSIPIVLSNKTLFQVDSLGNFIKILDLPNNTTGIVSGNNKIYLFDKHFQKNKTDYSIFSLSKYGYVKLLTMETPITDVNIYDSNLFFTTKNRLYYAEEQARSFSQIISLPQEKDTIISIAEDFANRALYFSTKDTIYRSRNNVLEYVCTEFGGILKYDGEGLLVFNPEKSLVVRFQNNLLYSSEAGNDHLPKIDKENYLSDKELKKLSLSEVRKLILQNRISEAVGAYSYLVAKDSSNLDLLSEYSYALALSGAYDCALMNLDRVRLASPMNIGDKFYAALVFSLMGYDDLYMDFIRSIPESKIPKWISLDKHLELSAKYREPPLVTQDDYMATLKRISNITANGLYLQAIAIYEEIIDDYPDEYLPHVGYSIILDKLNLHKKAVDELNKAITLMGDTSELANAKEVFEKRRIELKDKIESPQKVKNQFFKLKNNFNPQTMLYAGGTIAESAISVDSRFGFYLTNTFNGAIELGATGNSGDFSVDFGISAYQRFGILVWGEGLNLEIGSPTTLSLKSSGGLSFINQKKNSSWDILFDWYLPIGNGKNSYGISIGKSFYFGKRQ